MFYNFLFPRAPVRVKQPQFPINKAQKITLKNKIEILIEGLQKKKVSQSDTRELWIGLCSITFLLHSYQKLRLEEKIQVGPIFVQNSEYFGDERKTSY